MFGQNLLKDAFDLFFPPACIICGRVTQSGLICFCCRPRTHEDRRRRCHECYSPIGEEEQNSRRPVCELCRLYPLPFRRMRYLWNYSGTARALIRTMKYRPSRKLCQWVGGRLADEIEHFDLLAYWDLIVPVPSSARSLRKRGFNQCFEIARAFTHRRGLGGKACPGALIHCGGITPQASLPHEQRLKNVRNTFAASSGRVRDRSVLLIDDVTTTGATAVSAASALLQAGARAVDLLTACRADAWIEFRTSVSTLAAPAIPRRS